ncbi:biotin--[acetyl-CoA-carboxylase] ligase [Thermococcus barophilus]|uniref:Biotin--acetyl-CoA-carboxylase ligase n=1 Tax=Thermococcus barophilus TaxID=55802 RepID=A0A0S1XDT2_THEBA|nr:biotin--[acetyl-CoA-carboxylase] ligase [Thermococcus barophilus]ALM75942.1 Biotin--acetyl-CoA-carboxylase ligase [Thermococcus barophilus]
MPRKVIKDNKIKRELLKTLRESDVVSGDEIGEKLGISRVAVWKHVRELIELGYEIESTPKGYKLLKEPNKPYPWELDVKAHYYSSVDSTMNVAKELAEKGEEEWTFIIAEEQTAGRGRLKRSWISQKGGLYFSVILRPKIKLTEIEKILIPSSLAVAKTIQEYGLTPQVSQAGDVFINGKKVSGLLVEAEGELDMVDFLILGIGVNVNNEVPGKFNATSLKRELGKEINLLEFSRKLFANLRRELKERDL